MAVATFEGRAVEHPDLGVGNCLDPGSGLADSSQDVVVGREGHEHSRSVRLAVEHASSRLTICPGGTC